MRTMNTQYDAFFKREENCATPSRYAPFRRISRSFLLFFYPRLVLFFRRVCVRRGLCDARGCCLL